MRVGCVCWLVAWVVAVWCAGSSVAVAQEGDVEPPVLVGKVRVVYPKEAKTQGVEAVVKAELEISAQGVVTRVEVVSVAPDQARGLGFEEAVKSALMGLSFEPARRGGEAIPVRIGYTYRFTLNDGRTGEETAKAGSSKIVGRVLELGTRDPMVGARVVVFQKDGGGDRAQSFEAWTDPEGRFAFDALAAGEWAIWVESEDHFPERTLERLDESVTLDLLLRIERRSYNRFDVLVEVDRDAPRVTRRVIPTAEIERMPGVYGDPLKVLQALPGVAQTNFLTSDVVIRGGAPQDTAFYALGLEVPAVFHFGGIRGIFPAQMVDRVVMYPGDFPVYYGRSMGGVVDVIPPDSTGEHLHGALDVSLLDTSLVLEVPISDSMWVAVAGRRSYIDGVVGAVNLAFNEQVVFPRYWDAHVQLGWRPSAAHDVRFFAFAADDDFVAYGPRSEFRADEESLPETSLVQTGVRHVWSGPSRGMRWETVAGFGWARSRSFEGVSGSFGDVLSTFETHAHRWMGRSSLEMRLTPRMRVQTGVEAVWNQGTIESELSLGDVWGDLPVDPERDPFGGPDINAPDEDGFGFGGLALLRSSESFLEAAAWMDWELALRDTGLTAIPGVRVERYGQIDAVAVDPRLRMEWVWSKMWTFRGAVGWMHQPPRLLELEPLLGGDLLEPSRALQTSLAVETRVVPGLVADMSVYVKQLDDLVVLSEQVIPRYTNAGRGRVYGAEWLLRVPLRDSFNGWIAYTLSRAERWNAKTQRFEEFAFNQTHNVTVFAAYLLPRNWSVSGRFRYASGFPLFDAFDLEEVLGHSSDFIQWDVRVDKTWVYDNWTMNAYFDIQNVTNRLNFLSGSTDGSNGVPPPGVPILPIFGVNTKF